MGLAIIIPGVSYADANLGKVTITGNRPIEALAIIGQNNVVSQAQFNVRMYPYNTTDRGIIWSIDSGGAYATINSTTGELFAIEGADEDTVVIRATSSADATITATKTITVSFTTHTIVDLEYIAADGEKYVEVEIAPTASTVIKADFKIANVALNNTTDRQFVYTDNNNVSVSYSKRWNVFAINYVGAKVKSLVSFYDRGEVESSASGATLYDKTTGNYVTLTNGSASSGSFGTRLVLFNGLNSSQTFKKVLIYAFSVSDNGADLVNLKPVLFDGVPCFYDSVADRYLDIVGDSGSIWYATAEDPNNEILYTE